MLQSVVSGIAALSLESQTAEANVGQSSDDDQDIFQRHILLLHPVAYRISTQVHVSGRLQQDQLASLE